MNINVYLGRDGQERIARGEAVYYWDFVVREADDPANPKHSVLVASNVTCTFPDRESLIPEVVAGLHEKIAEINLEAAERIAEIEERLRSVQMLEMS